MEFQVFGGHKALLTALLVTSNVSSIHWYLEAAADRWTLGRKRGITETIAQTEEPTALSFSGQISSHPPNHARAQGDSRVLRHYWRKPFPHKTPQEEQLTRTETQIGTAGEGSIPTSITLTGGTVIHQICWKLFAVVMLFPWQKLSAPRCLWILLPWALPAIASQKNPLCRKKSIYL